MAQITADGNSDVIDWLGGHGELVAWGTWGGGTARLQFAKAPTPAAGDWINVEDVVLVAENGIKNFTLTTGKLRVTLTGATAPALNVVVCGLITHGDQPRSIKHTA